MADDNDKNNGYELCERFRADMKRPLAERVYSEDDLIDIFDTATDYDDQLVRVEVLMLAARMYPESVDLQCRRAIFYGDTVGEDTANDYIDSKAQASGTLWECLKMCKLNPDEIDVGDTLTKFLLTNRLTEDEESYQFVRAVYNFKAASWLSSNLNNVVGECDNPEYLLRTISTTEFNDHDLQIAVLEKLTEIDPYNADYWVMLYEEHAKESENESAQNALEYALAIDPKHKQALKYSIAAMPEDKIIDALDKYLEIEKNATDLFDKLADKTMQSDNQQLIYYIMAKAATTGNATVHLAELAVELRDQDILVQLCRSIIEHGEPIADEWHQMAEKAISYGLHNAATIILAMFEKATGITIQDDWIAMRIFFHSEMYEEAIGTFMIADEKSNITTEQNFYNAYLLTIFSLMRVGQTAAALEAAKGMQEIVNDRWKLMPQSAEIYGTRMLLRDIIKRIKANKDGDFSDFDPLNYF